MFTVIIPSRESGNVDTCVDSLRARGEDCRVIVIDSGLDKRRGDCEYIDGIDPFVYARAINQGIKAAGGDVILLNDDTELLTEKGFSCLEKAADEHPEYGVLSCGIHGAVCNPLQEPTGENELRDVQNMVAFVCVFIRHTLIQAIGLLDERFTGYGCDDSDYCRRALMHGWRVGVWDGCSVDHSHEEKSSYRSQHDYEKIYEDNRRIYALKWQHPLWLLDAQNALDAKVDLLYLACNRRAFTEESVRCLLENTDWFLVNKLFLWDDGSTDGTAEFLRNISKSIDTEVVLRNSGSGGPIGPMREFIQESTAPLLCKLDNDTMVCPEWLNVLTETMERHPELDVLGFEGCQPEGNAPSDNYGQRRSYARVKQVGGLALIRKRAFSDSLPTVEGKYNGWWDWQGAHSELVKGWITPSLPIFVLDRITCEPWAGLSKEYEGNGWQRPWWRYGPQHKALWSWWKKGA
jgi:GT2 family glycosyltransferase